MLNCDWFQPFAQSRYTVGVIYLVILNLPRAIRFRSENIIITGIIPGSKRTKEYEFLYKAFGQGVEYSLDRWVFPFN